MSRKNLNSNQMDAQKVDMYMLMNSKFFDGAQLPAIRERLLNLDDSKWGLLQLTQFKDPTTALILSIFLGGMGVDRFFIGDTGIGVAKLLTCGGFWVWYFIDIFMIQGATRQKNLNVIQTLLM